ncbi:hypothetical protein SLE2022_312090 [Rubroshorea leprosula]
MSVNAQKREFNVLNYGAVGNGQVDDSTAFVKAWNEACQVVEVTPTIVIPKGKTFLVQPLTFAGPCKSSNINIMLSGVIKAPDGPKNWKGKDISTWILFKDITGLNVDGSSIVDGQGKGWWDISCKINKRKGCGTLAPTAFRFRSCKHLKIRNINLINSPQTHISLLGCQDVEISSSTIQSPGNSPNTDGIHLQSSTQVSIHNMEIGDGDDCISIGDDISYINITEVNCGPGHGISIGSLGKGGSVVNVHDITVNHVNFKETTNGARIKTWQVGKGTVQHIMFSNMNFTNVKNPIIIDQYYCDVANKCGKTDTGVQISDLQYNEAVGTSQTKVAINLNCSHNFPCKNIKLNNIKLTSAVPRKQVVSECNFAHGVATGVVIPKSCLELEN